MIFLSVRASSASLCSTCFRVSHIWSAHVPTYTQVCTTASLFIVSIMSLLWREWLPCAQRRSQVSLAGGADRIPGGAGINLNTYSYGKRDNAIISPHYKLNLHVCSKDNIMCVSCKVLLILNFNFLSEKYGDTLFGVKYKIQDPKSSARKCQKIHNNH